MCYDFKQQSRVYIYDLPLDTLISFSSNHFVCTCFFWMYIFKICPLRNLYIWEMSLFILVSYIMSDIPNCTSPKAEHNRSGMDIHLTILPDNISQYQLDMHILTMEKVHRHKNWCAVWPNCKREKVTCEERKQAIKQEGKWCRAHALQLVMGTYVWQQILQA